MDAALMPIMYVVLGLAAAGFFMWRGKAMRAKVQQDYAHSKAGAIAQRLGFTLERGDPETNLQVAERGGLQKQDVDVLLSGTAHGIPMEIIYRRKVQDATKAMDMLVGQSVTSVGWDCRIVAKLGVDLGRIQLRLREPQQHLQAGDYFGGEAPPEVRTGDANLDATFLIQADRPEVGTALAPHLAPLPQLQYVHFVGAPGFLSYDMAHDAYAKYGTGMATGYGLHALDQVLHSLASMVCALENRPPPGAITPAAPAPTA